MFLDIWHNILSKIEHTYYFQLIEVCKYFNITTKKIKTYKNNRNKMLIITSYDLNFFYYYNRSETLENILISVYNTIAQYDLELFKNFINIINQMSDKKYTLYIVSIHLQKYKSDANYLGVISYRTKQNIIDDMLECVQLRIDNL